MTTISLHKYHDQINLLIEDSQYSLAASHCRYILQQHPRHVDTYRLLARTMIDQGDYSGATELFQRVLSADPNDYIAHAGLSVVYREEDVLSQAIWHLERAYEIEPYNGAIQQELKGLYIEYSEQRARREDGGFEMEIPESLPLTKGALARLYIQGEFYAQAIDILKEALAEDEDRIDLEVLLVEALWRDFQRKDAVQECLQVLEKLPNCITANAVLAEIWLQIGRIDEAQDYLQELQALTLMDISNQNLESPAGSAFQPEGAIVLPVVFELERMGDDSLSLAEEQSASNDSLVTEEGDDYQWLEGLGDEFVVTETEPALDEPFSATTDSDWLRRELAESDEETAVSDDISNWLDEMPDDEAGEDTGIDPLGAVAAGAVAAGIIGSQLKDEEVDDAEDTFSWLSEENLEKDVPEDDETIFSQIERVEEAEEMPDWLVDMSGDDLEPIQADPSEMAVFMEPGGETDFLSDTEDEDENIYDWLEGVVSDEPVDELESGELDLSQFVEFDDGEDAEDDEEIVWRLTDELNPPNESDLDEVLEEFNFEVSPDETGDLDEAPDWLMDSGGLDDPDPVDTIEAVDDENADESDTGIGALGAIGAGVVAAGIVGSQLKDDDDGPDALALDDSPSETGDLEDVPDWLMGSSGTDELDEASLTESASNEIADELAEWVAANQPEVEEGEALPDWMSDDSSASGEPVSEPIQDAEIEEEDDFFTSDLPSWLSDSSADIDDSALLDSAPLDLDEPVAEDSSLLDEADLPDWLMGGNMDMDDSGFLETGNLSDEPVVAEASDTSEDLPDWLMGDSATIEDEEAAQPQSESDDDVLDWLSDDVDSEDVDAVEEDDDGISATAVVGGLLGAAAAGAFAKELFDDDENEDPPEPVVIDSHLEDEVTEDAVSDKQDDLIGPQDEPEKPESSAQEESDEFDWLDDLDGTSLSADTDSLPMDDLGDDLDWMDFENSDDSDDLNLDALLGLEPEEKETPEDEAEPVISGLAEDESLDWLDALAGDEPEAVDEMPTWQWTEDNDADPTQMVEETDDSAGISETVRPEVDDVDAIFSEEPAEAELVEDLDDAMSWLEDLAAEPDAPVEELPSVAEDMDLDALFATDADVDLLSSDSEQTETLDEIFAADTQNDSWLEGLANADGDPVPDFLGEESEFDIDGLFGDDDVVETAVSLESEDAVDALDDMGEPPEDPEEAMAWLERLAARQGAPLDELPYVDEAPEEDGIGAAEVVAGAAALGALGAVLADDDDESESVDEIFEQVEPEIDLDAVEDDFMSMEVPEDPEEAMAWLEKLAARQGAPLDELPSVSEDDEIPPEPEISAEDDLFGFDEEDSTFEAFFADADALPELDEVDDGAIGDLDDAMAWLDGLEEDDLTETLVEASDDFAEDIPVVEESASGLASDLSDELDWLEEVTASDGETAVYNPDEISVSDDDLSNALEQLALLTAVGAVVGVAVADKDESEEIEEKTAVVESETEAIGDASADMSAEDFVDEMPEDPDEAMAWLEKLAARQGAPLDELPSVEEDEYDDLAAAGAAQAAEAEDEFIIDEVLVSTETETDESSAIEETASDIAPEDMDMDDAMAWLEQLAARQGTSLDELPTVDESDLDGDIAAPDWVSDAQEEAEDEPGIVAEALVVEEIVSAVTDSPTEDDTVDLPEDMDMDDAMAWLEQLAARQGTPLDELPTVDDAPETEDDIDTPEWIAQQTGPLDSEALDSLDIPEVSDELLESTSDEDFFAALDEVPAIEGIETDSKDSDLEEIDDSMPDWLSGNEEESPLGHTGWLNTIDEPDMGGWLEAEAEASTSSDVVYDSIPEAVDTDSLLNTGGLEETGNLQGTASRGDTGELRLPDDMNAGSMFTTELDEAQVLADLDLDDFGMGLDQAQLEAARSSLAGGDIDAALHDYQGLVESGESMHTVIADLERASDLHQDQPMVRRMLGDAYMRNGQINKAIETYRGALDQM